MGRRPISGAAMTAAEKQRRYREKRRAELAVIREKAAAKDKEPDAWEAALKKEQLAAARKKGREEARRPDTGYRDGRVSAICDVADFFARHDRADLARIILHNFMIDREAAAAVLEADKRTKSATLSSLDKANAWDTPPPVPSYIR